MAKVKAEKPADQTAAKGAQTGAKRKKNDPLRPQPAWLFPPDEENPVLNPKVKSTEEVEKDTKERLEAIKFLEHRAVSAPVKDAPPGVLMQLIGAFLASYGFNSTGRIFATEREARRKVKSWNDKLGKKLDKGIPSLVQIFNRWYKEWEMEQTELKQLKSGDTSSSEEASDDSSDETAEAKTAKKVTKKAGKGGSDSDSSSSSSDSDADDEEEKAKPTKQSKSSKKATTDLPSKKRKSPSVSDSDDSSGSDSSSSEEEAAPAKKQKVEVKTNGKQSKVTTTQKANGVKSKEAVKKTVSKPAESSNDSSSSSESDSDSDSSDGGAKTNGATAAVNGTGESTDSTSTLAGDAKEKESSSDDSSDSSGSSSSSDDDDAPPAALTPAASKRKRSKSPAAATPTSASAAKLAKKSNEPFSRIPKDQYVDPRLSSNKYVPYDYAQKAHEDLIVTKGKGFTKEKNKKKRGSYRGGMIDLGGGKGIKFED